MHQLRWALLGALAAVPGCKLFEHKKDAPSPAAPAPAPTPGGTPVASGSGAPATPGTATASASGSGSTTEPLTLRDVTYALQVTLGGAVATPAAAEVTYLDVRELLSNRCTQCHGPASVLDLTAFPFKGRFATPADAVKELLARTQDAARPMPPAPNAALPAADLQTLKNWQAAGLKDKPTVAPPPAPAVPFADTLTVHLKARAAHATQDIEASYPWNGSGQFTGALHLPLYDTVAVKLTVTGDDGAELAAKAYDDLAVGVEGDFRFALPGPDAAAIRAHVVDETPPAAGGDGFVAASVVDETALTLTWGRGTDQLSTPEALTYAVYVADTAAGLDSVEHVLANGRKAMDFSKNLAGSRITGLTQGRTYFFAVLVKDEAGNTTLYKVLQQATAADKVAPTVATPAVRATNLTDERVTLAWAAAADNLSPPDKLTYQVYFSDADNLKTAADALANGTLVGTTQPGVATLSVTGLVPTTTYYFNVVAADEHGNKTAYATARVVSAAEGGARTPLDHGAECAARLGTVKPFSCFDGQLLPIAVDGAEIAPNLTAVQASHYHFGRNDAQTGAQQVCDKPPLLGLGTYGHCIPYARIGRVKTYRPDGSENPDVDGVFTCRRYLPRLGPQTYQGQSYDGSMYPAFEDIAMILHDRVSGETCFFQMLDPNFRAKDGRRIPPPTEEALPAGTPAYALAAKDFWLNAADTAAKKCGRCHDSDPWVHSPYVEQARDAAGKPLVPAGGVGAPGTGKYSVIGARGFYKWEKSVAVASTDATGTNGKSCTSCHNIGSINTCASWMRQSTGVDEGPNLSLTGRNDFAYRHWMPPADQNVTGDAAWTSSGYKAAADRIAACCANPKAAGCTTAPIMKVPPPYALP